MSKNVAVFVDVANIFYAAKAAGVDIDYVTLLKASSAGRDLVRAYAYTGLDPDNENQRNFHDFLRRHGYKVVSKDIRKYGDGKVKANLDIELVVDMMKTARNLDIAIVVSGDGDFAPAIRAVQEMGVRVEVVSFRGNTSSDLIDVADIFTDITQIAKVEKGSSRSGRRVATDDEDLSMTEVPDKMTEGTGDGRRRGRGSRSRTGDAAAAPAARRATAATRTRTAAARDTVAAEGGLVALPGEKLSRAGRTAAAAAPDVTADEAVAPDVELEAEEAPEGARSPDDGPIEGETEEEGRRRRRRRRGGRGRGRGRAREGVAAGDGEPLEVDEAPELDDVEPLPAPTPRRSAFSFGSVWDSQLGKAPAAAPSGPVGGQPIDEDEDLEEPAIPEYLLAERRQRDANRGRPGRGGRGRGGAYAAALDRERFGAGGRGGASVSRYAEPQPRDRALPAGRGAGPSRGPRPVGRGYERPEPRSTGNEPWSEVPPEIEAMLRAQLAASGGRPSRPAPQAPSRERGEEQGTPPPSEAAPEAASSGATAAPGRARRPAGPRRGTRASGAASGAAAGDGPAAQPAAGAAEAPTRSRRGSGRVAGTAAAGEAAEAPKRPRRRATAADAAGGEAPSEVPGAVAEVEAPKRRVSRKKAAAD